MKKSLFALAAMASLGLFAFGCGDGESGDACLTSLDCKTEDGYICHPKEGTCQPNDGCGLKCDASLGQTCNTTNGQCVTGSAAENCHLNGDKCNDGFTCNQDNEGAWGCMPNDAKCPNKTVWNHSANGGKGGCVDEESEVQTCPDGSNDSCDEGYVCNQDTFECEPKQVSDKPRPYKFVKIDDLSPVEYDRPKKEDPGVDIDAIVLTKTDGGKVYATSADSYARGDGQSSKESRRAYVPEEALGAPDSFVGYPNDMANCNYYKGTVPDTNAPDEAYVYTFVSLGGLGGHIIVGMGGDIEEGDTLEVIELSDCNLKNTQSDSGKAHVEPDGLKVQVSTGSKIDSEWTVLTSGQARAGILSVVIPELKVVYDDGTDI